MNTNIKKKIKYGGVANAVSSNIDSCGISNCKHDKNIPMFFNLYRRNEDVKLIEWCFLLGLHENRNFFSD